MAYSSVSRLFQLAAFILIVHSVLSQGQGPPAAPTEEETACVKDKCEFEMKSQADAGKCKDDETLLACVTKCSESLAMTCYGPPGCAPKIPDTAKNLCEYMDKNKKVCVKDVKVYKKMMGPQFTGIKTTVDADDKQSAECKKLVENFKKFFDDEIKHDDLKAAVLDDDDDSSAAKSAAGFTMICAVMFFAYIH